METDDVVDGFRSLPTPAISDALDRLGIVGQAFGIAPLDPTFRLAGRAWTIRYRPAGAVEPGSVGDYIDDVPPTSVVRQGDVLVGDADGIVVVPATRESEVLQLAHSIEGAEKAIEQAVAGGVRLDQARTQFRYHELQTRIRRE